MEEIIMAKKPVNTYKIDSGFYDKLDRFVKEVLDEGFDRFSEEFANVEGFIENAKKDRKKRTDKTFRTTPKEMYLLESLYYNIFDRAYREDFNKAKQTVIILPDCLAIRGDKCKKKKKKFGDVCTHCAKKCEVSRIMKFAEGYGIEGYFSKRQLTQQLEKIKKKHKGSLGVIGISCVLTLASGMRSAREAGVPARGVFLNFTGCDHWSAKAFPTETIFEKIKAIIEEKHGKKD